jgi:16S rRNA (guanine527-N7)-methyltransferase
VKNNRDVFDIVTSRAVAKLSILTELCLPLVSVNGCFISMKGDATTELKEIDNNLKVLNSKIEEIKTFILPFENSSRTLIKIKKLGKISPLYPRSFKEIKRKPL